MNIIKRLRRWWYRDSPKEVKSYWVYGSDICLENDYKNHVKGATNFMFGYCCIPGVEGSIDALYHCKYCQTIMHFPVHKNLNEKELSEKRKIETKNFKLPIKLPKPIPTLELSGRGNLPKRRKK